MVKSGMKLARAVLNANGIVLFNTGTELSDEKISKLIEMGIENVCVEGRPNIEKPKEELLREVEMRFENVKDDSIMILIKSVVKKHIEDLYGET